MELRAMGITLTLNNAEARVLAKLLGNLTGDIEDFLDLYPNDVKITGELYRLLETAGLDKE